MESQSKRPCSLSKVVFLFRREKCSIPTVLSGNAVFQRFLFLSWKAFTRVNITFGRKQCKRDSSQRLKNFVSALPFRGGSWIPSQKTSGAKARVFKEVLSARLKPCPDTCMAVSIKSGNWLSEQLSGFGNL